MRGWESKFWKRENERTKVGSPWEEHGIWQLLKIWTYRLSRTGRVEWRTFKEAAPQFWVLKKNIVDYQKKVDKAKKAAEHEAGNAAKVAVRVCSRGMGNRGGKRSRGTRGRGRGRGRGSGRGAPMVGGSSAGADNSDLDSEPIRMTKSSGGSSSSDSESKAEIPIPRSCWAHPVWVIWAWCLMTIGLNLLLQYDLAHAHRYTIALLKVQIFKIAILWSPAIQMLLIVISQGVVPRVAASGSNLIPVILAAGTLPQLLFQGVHPVSLSISPRIALESCALKAGSPNEFPMGLVWAGGVPPRPLLLLPPLPRSGHLESMVAGSLHPQVGTLWYKIVD